MGNHFKTTNVQMKELISNMTLVRAHWHPDLWGPLGYSGSQGKGLFWGEGRQEDHTDVVA